MRYAKLIDGVISYAPRKITNQDESITYNPTGEMLMPLGYLPVTYTDVPEVEEGYMPVSHWEEQDGAIVQVWTAEEDPYYYEASPDEVAEALEGIL